MLSFFIAYQALTLATFPLIAFGAGDEGRKPARTYLATLLTFSVGLLLPAMVWAYAVAGTLEFRSGGICKSGLFFRTARINRLASGSPG